MSWILPFTCSSSGLMGTSLAMAPFLLTSVSRDAPTCRTNSSSSSSRAGHPAIAMETRRADMREVAQSGRSQLEVGTKGRSIDRRHWAASREEAEVTEVVGADGEDVLG